MEPTIAPIITDKVLLAGFGTLLIVLQLVYHMMSKSSTEKIISASNASMEKILTASADSMEKIIMAARDMMKSFDQHVVTGDETYILLKEISKVISTRSSDGRPLVFNPQAHIETQQKLVSSQETANQTLKTVCKILERLEGAVKAQTIECRIHRKDE